MYLGHRMLYPYKELEKNTGHTTNTHTPIDFPQSDEVQQTKPEEELKWVEGVGGGRGSSGDNVAGCRGGGCMMTDCHKLYISSIMDNHVAKNLEQKK